MDLTAPPAADPLMIALERELQPGERVLWSGKRLARVNTGGFAIWLFAVPWTAFALFWTVMAATGADALSDTVGPVGWAFALFGLPFVAVGLGTLVLPVLPLLGAGSTLFAAPTAACCGWRYSAGACGANRSNAAASARFSAASGAMAKDRCG